MSQLQVPLLHQTKRGRILKKLGRASLCLLVNMHLFDQFVIVRTSAGVPGKKGFFRPFF